MHHRLEKISANHIADKGLGIRLYKELKMQVFFFNPIRKWQKTRTDISLRGSKDG